MSSSIISKIEAGKKQRVRIVVAVSALVVVLITLSILFIQFLLKNERVEIEGHIKEVGKQSAVAAGNLIKGDFQTLKVYAHFLEKEPKYMNKSHIKTGLKTAIKDTRFYSMGLAYPNGEIFIYDADKGFAPSINVKDFRYFKESMNGNICIDFMQSFYDDDKLIVLYSVPVKIDGKVVAVLTGAHSAYDYSRAIDITAFNNEAVIHIIDGTGHLILKDESPKTVLKNSIFETDDVPNTLRKEALSATEPFSYWFTDEFNVRKVASFIPIGYNNWKILAILPFSAISHNTNTVMKYAIIFVMLINIIVIIGIRYNVLIRQRSDNMIMDIALRDDVTKCKNKTSFYLEGEKILMKNLQPDENLAVISMDVDNFKIINEIYGIKKGDVVLRDIAKILSKNIAEKGIFARLNDDVFAIMYRYGDEKELIALIDSISEAVLNLKLNIKVIPSFGIFKVTENTLPINTMCDRANLAKRTIKGLVGNRYAFFTEKLSQAIRADKEIEDEMKPALENKEFIMYLQPKIDMKTMVPCGSEALIRWKHPKKGLVPPYKFVPLFERNGFIVNIDKFMWEEACIAIRSWIDAGYEPLPISVNLSRIHFKYENLVETIEDLVRKYDVPKKYLELELTESAFLDNEGAVNSSIVKLQDMGFTIAMDDFGMGYSSLNMLRKLPVNILKLDRGFINEATCTERGFIVLNHVINMAKDLKTTVLCEGIETTAQADTLRKAGCDIAQGYLYAKPMPLDEYNQYVYHHEGAYEV